MRRIELGDRLIEERNAGGNGIRPTEPGPMKIVNPTRYSLYARICPFCRKTRGKIRKLRTAWCQYSDRCLSLD
jgi:hypothetical protein